MVCSIQQDLHQVHEGADCIQKHIETIPTAYRRKQSKLHMLEVHRLGKIPAVVMNPPYLAI